MRATEPGEALHTMALRRGPSYSLRSAPVSRQPRTGPRAGCRWRLTLFASKYAVGFPVPSESYEHEERARTVNMPHEQTAPTARSVLNVLL